MLSLLSIQFIFVPIATVLLFPQYFLKGILYNIIFQSYLEFQRRQHVTVVRRQKPRDRLSKEIMSLVSTYIGDNHCTEHATVV